MFFTCKKCGESFNSDALNDGEIAVCHSCTCWHVTKKVDGKLTLELFEYNEESFNQLKESFKIG